MIDYPNHMTLGDEDDYSEEIPEPETFSHEFRDGSRITLPDFDNPVVTGARQCDAREVAKWIEENEADTEQSIQYIKKNYKI